MHTYPIQVFTLLGVIGQIERCAGANSQPLECVFAYFWRHWPFRPGRELFGVLESPWGSPEVPGSPITLINIGATTPTMEYSFPASRHLHLLWPLHVDHPHMLPKGPKITLTLTLVWKAFARNRANPTSPAFSSHRDLPRVKFSAPGVRFQSVSGSKAFISRPPAKHMAVPLHEPFRTLAPPAWAEAPIS